MNFNSLAEFGDFLGTLSMEPALNAALEHIGQAVENTAKGEFGVYQPAVGGFNAWDELAPYTKDDRVRKGYTENDPLLRSGALRASISHVVDTVPAAWAGREAKGEVVIGSEDPVMAYQELGTSRIPPRPVLGPAVIHNVQLIQQLAGHAAVMGLLPKGAPTPPGLWSPKALYKFTV